jgi:hypothetical protein
MKLNTSRGAMLAASLVAAIVLAGCGGNDDYQVSNTPPPAPVPTPTPTPTPVVDAFYAAVLAMIGTSPEDTEPGSIDAIVATSPEDTEPQPLG